MSVIPDQRNGNPDLTVAGGKVATLDFADWAVLEPEVKRGGGALAVCNGGAFEEVEGFGAFEGEAFTKT